MAKERSSPYLLGQRSNYWLKVKSKSSLEAIIAGYTEGAGRRENIFGALVLAAHGREGQLVHLGNVGTGFSENEMQTLLKRLKPLKTTKTTISGEVKAPAPITWVRPQLVCEVEYASWTPDKKLRLPRYMRLRIDVPPEECLVNST